MADLFAEELPSPPPPAEPGETAPLADRLRPRRLDEVVGQDHLTGPDGAIGRMVAAGKLASMILWGPPDGKTTSAPAADAVMRFRLISAVFSDSPTSIICSPRRASTAARPATLLFVDNPPLQPRPAGRFLPSVDDGTVVLASPPLNPSFELNALSVAVPGPHPQPARRRRARKCSAPPGRCRQAIPVTRRHATPGRDADGEGLRSQPPRHVLDLHRVAARSAALRALHRRVALRH